MSETKEKNNETPPMSIPASVDPQLKTLLENILKNMETQSNMTPLITKIDSMADEIQKIYKKLEQYETNESMEEPTDTTSTITFATPIASTHTLPNAESTLPNDPVDSDDEMERKMIKALESRGDSDLIEPSSPKKGRKKKVPDDTKKPSARKKK